ncbi:DUF262 domain-containing protein [Nocardia jiangsuensis]|uniref:DUF262 domain-containing protein n=1 Tax=Nocardia jiangsuensis TaxID=1691563 RepID=A0ABV8E173_9NOCA
MDDFESDDDMKANELDDEVPDEVSEEDNGDDSLTAADVQDVLLYTLDWSVESLLDRIGRTFDINPAFQRRDAWTSERKSKYIESLMLGLPIPQVVLAEDKNSKRFIVLDGKQRLITMKQFGAPDEQYQSFRLRRLKFLPQLIGKTFQQIENSADNAEWAENFLSQPVRTIVVRNWGNTKVLYEVFIRLNQGSLALSPQELRQALYPGSFSTFINTRSGSSKAIQRARRIKREDFRMRDAEMLLRGVAFQDSLESYGGDLRDFLDKMCERGNKEWATRQSEFESLADSLEKSIERAEKIFGQGETYFRYQAEREPFGYVRRFNIAVFDLMTMVLASPEVTDEFVESKWNELRTEFQMLCVNDPEFEDAIKSTTKTERATALRIIRFGEAVQRHLGGELEAVRRARALLARAEA